MWYHNFLCQIGPGVRHTPEVAEAKEEAKREVGENNKEENEDSIKDKRRN